MKDKEPKLIWDNIKPIGEVMKSKSTKIVIELVARDGIRYINIRDWYKKKSTNEWKPSIKGLSLPLIYFIDEKNTTPAADIIKHMNEALEQAKDFPIEGNEVWFPPK